MAGGFTCPHCDTFNKCNCKSCKETYHDKDQTDNFVSWDDAGELCICSNCSKKFHEGQSLDIEWNRMIESFSKTLTKEVCYEWLFNCINKDEGKLAKNPNSNKYMEYSNKEYLMYTTYGHKEEWFRRVFIYHFKVSPESIRRQGLAGLRELQINKILE